MTGPTNHPSMDIIGTLGSELAGRSIALCITGSVAAVRCVDIARLLMRHGAQVIPVMTQAACDLISPELMEWATGHPAVTCLTGAIEHVALAGNVANPCHLVLVAPATANTIGKIAAGIDDTPVTTVVTTAVGEGIPVMVVPAMHEPMYRHPLVMRNIETLNQFGIPVFVPPVSEGKAKIPDPEAVVTMVRSLLEFEGDRPLRGKRVVITAGRTVEYLDPIRVVSNNSTGRMGTALAATAAALGANVTLVLGKAVVDPPVGVHTVQVETAEQMQKAVETELAGTGSGTTAAVDIFVAAAAVGDWKAVRQADTKVTTHGTDTLTVELTPTPKILDSVKKLSPATKVIAFRAQHGFTPQELYDDAFARLQKAGADMIAANDTAQDGVGFESTTNQMLLVHADGSRVDLPLADKVQIALGIWKDFLHTVV